MNIIIHFLTLIRWKVISLLDGIILPLKQCPGVLLPHSLPLPPMKYCNAIKLGCSLVAKVTSLLERRLPPYLSLLLLHLCSNTINKVGVQHFQYWVAQRKKKFLLQITWPGILTFGGLFAAGLYLDIPYGVCREKAHGKVRCNKKERKILFSTIQTLLI